MSGTEEGRTWVTWMGSTHNIFWRCPDLLWPECSDTLRGQAAEPFWLFPCSLCHFSGESRPGSVKGVGSGHRDLAPLAYDFYCPKGPTLRRDPTSALPVLKCLILNKGSHTFVLCPTLSFFTGCCKLGSWSWARSEMLMRKERYPPSFSFLIKFISKSQYLFLQCVSCCLPLVSLLTHPPRPSYRSWAQEQGYVPIKCYL